MNPREVTRKEFKAWLIQNAALFTKEKYEIDDIERLALACGFSGSYITEWATSAKFKKAKP